MFKLLRKVSRYITAVLTGKFDELADPKVQLEQAITEARDQHRVLREQAANVIANQKQAEIRLSKAMDELDELNKKARQAVLMADDAAKNGDAEKAANFNSAAASFAGRLISVEHEVESLKALAMQAARASDQAKHAVQQNATVLQKRLNERQRLLSQLDQAKMQEQMNKATASLSESVGEDVPSLKEVEEKIQLRYAKAAGMAELQGGSVESHMLEVEQATIDSEAEARLSEIRAKLGVAPTPKPVTQGESSQAEVPQAQAAEAEAEG